MPGFDDICSFASLYDAHLRSRRGKQGRAEVASFELDLGCNLALLSDELRRGTYRMSPYIHFGVRDPKRREVCAPCYRDRVVQRSLCDNVLGPVLEPRLIYDNAACRRGKGTLFALERLKGFLREHWRAHGSDGWVLRCDVEGFFASVRHDALLARLGRLPLDTPTKDLLAQIVASHRDSDGRGLPLGNQTSQWFALYYLDGLDRLVKERMHVRAYVRYMDDAVCVHADRAHAHLLAGARGRARRAGPSFQREDPACTPAPGHRLPWLALLVGPVRRCDLPPEGRRRAPPPCTAACRASATPRGARCRAPQLPGLPDLRRHRRPAVVLVPQRPAVRATPKRVLEGWAMREVSQEAVGLLSAPLYLGRLF